MRTAFTTSSNTGTDRRHTEDPANRSGAGDGWFTVSTNVNPVGADHRRGTRNGDEDMRRPIRFMASAAAFMTAAPLGLLTGAGIATAKDTFVPMNQVSRRCDFSETDYNGPTGYGRGTSVIRSSGSNLSADVTLDVAVPNMRYDVRLIQLPRPSSAPCLGGDPGVVMAPLQTDGVGHGSVSLHDSVEPGATGAWVWITRPDAFSQNPAEFYTSDMIVNF